MRTSLSLLGLASLAVATEEMDAVELLQMEVKHVIEEAREKEMNWTEHVMQQMDVWWENGFWAMRFPSSPRCGKSSFQELQVTIPTWRKQHPNEDGFCHFDNHAMWFRGAGGDDYYKNGGLHLGRWMPLCDTTGERAKNGGPELEFTYDGGTFTWTHTRNCIDIVDDPYCYSLGWLKGQGAWTEDLMKNKTAWQQLARQECSKLQAEFHFDDEEVTVGRHIFTTPLYFRSPFRWAHLAARRGPGRARLEHRAVTRTWNSLRGRGTPISKRLHAEHVYTKCMLGFGGAPGEMAYCYYKGCLLPGNRIGHYDECSYNP